MPEVSIIVPNFNHAEFLSQRLDSIFNQSFRDFEVIILDDNSTDNSREIIERYRDRSETSHIVYNEQNSGSTFRQWRKGIDLAAGRLIWIAESDDFCDNNFLQLAHLALLDERVALFYSKTVQVDKDGVYLRGLEWWLNDLDVSKWKTSHIANSKDEIENFLVYKNFFCNASSVVFRKKTIPDLLLNEASTFRFCGDWFFWLNYLKGTDSIAYSTGTMNYWRDHQSSTRAGIRPERNDEMFRIFSWIKTQGFCKNEYELLKYYFRMHIYKIPRTSPIRNMQFVGKHLYQTKYMPQLMLAYYLQPKRFIL